MFVQAWTVGAGKGDTGYHNVKLTNANMSAAQEEIRYVCDIWEQCPSLLRCREELQIHLDHKNKLADDPDAGRKICDLAPQ